MQSVALPPVLGVEWAMTTKNPVLPELEEDQPVDEISNDPGPHTTKKHAPDGGNEEQHCTASKHQRVISMHLTVYLIVKRTVATLFLCLPDTYIEGILLKLVSFTTHVITPAYTNPFVTTTI